MNKAKTGMITALAIFLFLSSGYGQELSDGERKIFYESAWLGLQGDYQLGMDPSGAGADEVMTKMQQLLSQNNLTENQLEDIIERGKQMSFTSAEEELAQEMDRKITDELTLDEKMAALNNFANKYGMSIGQVSSVFLRKLGRD